MPQSIYQYRGYVVGLQQRQSNIIVSVSPETPDLPILRRCLFEMAVRSEVEAIAEVKSRIDRVLSS